MTQQLEHLNEEQLAQRIVQYRKKAFHELWWSRRAAAFLLMFVVVGGFGTFALSSVNGTGTLVAWVTAFFTVVFINAFFLSIDFDNYSAKPLEGVYCSYLSSWMKADKDVADYIHAVNTVRTVTRYDYAVCGDWMENAQERKLEAQQKEACRHVHGLIT